MIDSNELLPHLDNTVPKGGYGVQQSKYNIALEAWRRGIKVKFVKKKTIIEYELSYGQNTHRFITAYGDLTTREAVNIAKDKALTKEYLSKAGLPVAEGSRFKDNETDKEILKFCNKLGYPLVLKPTDGIKGQGVVTNIQNDVELTAALQFVRDKLGHKDVLVERYVKGEELRVYYLENNILGAYIKRPASVVGDGICTIQELINQKNNKKKRDPYLSSRLIKVDLEVVNTLKKNNYTLDTVPPKDQQVYLQGKCNLSAGGDSVEVTEQLPTYIKEVASKVSQAIPGLVHGGIDIIANYETEQCIILEINHNAAFSGLLFPTIGKARDIPKYIIDYYFPETKGIERSNFYFDLTSLFLPLKAQSINEIEVAPIPLGKTYAKKLFVKGEFGNPKFKQWFKNKAINQGIHGCIEKIDNQSIIIYIASNTEKSLESFMDECYYNKFAIIKTVKAEKWDKPIRIGFEIIKEKKTELEKKPKKDLKPLKKEIKEKQNSNKKNSKQKGIMFRFAKKVRKIVKR